MILELVRGLRSALVTVSSQCSAGPTSPSDLVAAPHSRCSTSLGPKPCLLAAHSVILEPRALTQGLLLAELCWLDFSVSSCSCLLAVFCWLNFSVGYCHCPSQQTVVVVASSQCSAGPTSPSDLVAAPHRRCSTTLGRKPCLLAAVTP